MIARIPLGPYSDPAYAPGARGEDFPFARGVAVTPDNTRAYVTLRGSGKVAVVDALTLREIDVHADPTSAPPPKLPHLTDSRHPDGGGLYLQVVGNSRTWLLRYSIAGRRRVLGLGPWPLVSLAQARQLATQARQRLLDGVDPIEHRADERTLARLQAATALTFGETAAQYLDAHVGRWRGARS